MVSGLKCNLIEINRNHNGDYYFIYSIPNVKNYIKTGSKDRSELLVVGIPQSQLINYLKQEFPGSEFYLVDMGIFKK